MRRRPQGLRRSVDRGTYGLGMEPRNQGLQGADAVNRSGRQHGASRHRKARPSPARSKTRSTYGTFLRENREIPRAPAADGAAGRIGKAYGPTPMMNDRGKSDSPVVPTKAPNKAGQP